MNEQSTLDMPHQTSPLKLALAVALGTVLGGGVYVVAEIQHQKQQAQHAARALPLSAAADKPPKTAAVEAPKPAAAEPEKPTAADAPEPAAPEDPKAQALAARTAAEQILLDDARKQLESKNAVLAQATLDRMKRRFPRGTLAQERELLRIEVYKTRGQMPAAKRAARKFAKAYPENPQLGEIESLLEN